MGIAAIGKECLTMGEIKLKPCPKCGAEVVEDDWRRGAQAGGDRENMRHMREARYYRRRRGTTAVFPKKCEPKGVDNDR